MKPNLYIISHILLSVIILLSACKDERTEEQQNDPKIIFDDDIQLVFGAEGGQNDVHFSATSTWTAKVDQDWCSVTPSNGNSSTSTVTLTAKANETSYERNATLTLQCGTHSTCKTLIQKQRDALTLTSNRMEVSAEGGTITIEVKDNIPFEYHLDETVSSWLSETNTGSQTGTKLKFNVDANDSSDRREGKIVIQSGDKSETVTVYQEGEKPQLLLSKDDIAVGSKGGTVSIELRSGITYKMRMIYKVDWLNEISDYSSSYTHLFEVLPNESDEPRTAYIEFSNDEYGLSNKVTITQVQKGAIVVATDNYTVSPWGETLDFQVNTNVNFEVEYSADWIKQLPDSRAMQEVNLHFLISANPDSNQREAVITLSADDASQDIRIIQPGKQYDSIIQIVHTNNTFRIPVLTGTYFKPGQISWGDGTEDSYDEEAVHQYKTNDTYTVSIEASGATEVSFKDLKGITEVDLTQF